MLINPSDVPAQQGTDYPDRFKAWVAGRSRQRLGDMAGLKNFGVNLTTLEPGSASALRHWHSVQDEFIYVISGELVLVNNAGESILMPGMAAAFPAGEADGHCLINRSTHPATYLEVGDRTPGDCVTYPDVDLLAVHAAQGYRFTHADGRPYESSNQHQ